MTSTTITISYELNPPGQILKEAQELSASQTPTHVLEVNTSEVGLEMYYGALRVVIAKANNQLVNELTEWRDAVGKAELSKETPKMLKYDQMKKRQKGRMREGRGEKNKGQKE